MHAPAFIAEISSRRFLELVGLVAISMMLAGGWIRWHLSWLRSDAEEDVKDSKITSEQAERRIRRLNFYSPALVFGGVALLAIVMLQLARLPE